MNIFGHAGILGVPFDANSTFMRGPARAPGEIRRALHSESANLCCEDGLDLGTEERFTDFGDLILDDASTAFQNIRTAASSLLDQGTRVLSLGGDHSITFPLIEAFAARHGKLNILHIDAHADLYHEYDGNPHSHACPFARIMENELASRLVQVGIRTLNPHQREQASRFGVEVVEMKDWTDSHDFVFDGPLYISLDMDALDPAFAPGVSHHEPGGFTTRQVLSIIQRLDADVVGADIVELNPIRDQGGISGMAAAKILKELVAVMLG